MIRIVMISAHALGAIPQFLVEHAGEAGRAKAFELSNLPLGIIEQRKLFIPQQSILALLMASSRLLGENHLGLLLAPHMTARDYGLWGDYVLSAPTLGDSLRRGIGAMGYHSARDQLTLDVHGDSAFLSYNFAISGATNYEVMAYCATGVLLSVPRTYLGSEWRPNKISLDVTKRRESDALEETFGCPVLLGGNTICITFPSGLLDTPLPFGQTRPSVTLADIARERRVLAPVTTIGIVSELIRSQLTDMTVSLEAIAETMGLGRRTLQRELDRSGATFRDLVGIVRIARANELLEEPDVSVTAIAAELGYSSSAHFSRAYRKATGLAPSEYRHLGNNVLRGVAW